MIRRHLPTWRTVLLCLIAISLLIMTADTSPLWIYQGF